MRRDRYGVAAYFYGLEKDCSICFWHMRLGIEKCPQEDENSENRYRLFGFRVVGLGASVLRTPRQKLLYFRCDLLAGHRSEVCGKS